MCARRHAHVCTGRVCMRRKYLLQLRSLELLLDLTANVSNILRGHFSKLVCLACLQENTVTSSLALHGFST